MDLEKKEDKKEVSVIKQINVVIPYRLKFFDIREFVNKETFEKLGIEGCYKLFDEKILITADDLFSFFDGHMICNTWFMKDGIKRFGSHTYADRGYRPSTSKTGVVGGAHYIGKALDFDIYTKDWKFVHPNVLSTEKLRDRIIQNRSKFSYIRGLEVKIKWLHIDILTEKDTPRRTGSNNENKKIWTFDPNGSYKKLI
jgi:hypothetical protein